ncbi:hypothetical protein C0J52_04390, partial [Blattella germanica]
FRIKLRQLEFDSETFLRTIYQFTNYSIILQLKIKNIGFQHQFSIRTRSLAIDLLSLSPPHLRFLKEIRVTTVYILLAQILSGEIRDTPKEFASNHINLLRYKPPAKLRGRFLFIRTDRRQKLTSENMEKCLVTYYASFHD